MTGQESLDGVDHKILCLGNNSLDTDLRTRNLAQQRGLVYHGLLSELNAELTATHYESPGVYHSSVFDIPWSRLRTLAAQFDEVVMLAQPYHEWSHANAILETIEVMRDLPCRCWYQDPELLQQHRYWQDLVTSNPSFCIFPWINASIQQHQATVCCRSDHAVSSLYPEWQLHQDANIAQVRNDMMQGTLLPQHCGKCYHREKQGMISARQQQTVIWAHRLNLAHIQDLHAVTKPVIYDIRVGDVCNLMCRMCSPDNSHLIHREYTQLQLTQQPRKISDTDPFQWVDLQHAQRVYVTGGEPSVSPAFLRWLAHVQQQQRADLEILVNTNAHQFSQKFLDLAELLPNLQFIVSLDAWGPLNDYVRWPSDFETVVANINLLQHRGHKVSVNITISIYNISRLYDLLAGIGHAWPQMSVSIDTVTDPACLSPLLWPDRAQAHDVLQAAMVTACSQHNEAVTSVLRSLQQQFLIMPPTPASELVDFFRFNDALDASRAVRLRDYLPDLDLQRIQT